MCNLCNVNTNKAEAFAGKILEAFNMGSVSVMISIGHQTKLFDVMLRLGPADLSKIASESLLNKRYVQEWLASMVTASIVSYNAEAKTYTLPKEHAAFLTREAGNNNFATLFQFIPVIAHVEQDLIQAFKKGGGVPYEKFNRFHEVMAQESRQNFSNNLISKILPLEPSLTEKLEKGIDVLDVGCGSGTAINMLGKVFPNSRFIGLDLCKEPIQHAIKNSKSMNLDNVSFIQLDAQNMHFDYKFDLITTFDAIHDQAHPDRVLQNIYNNLKDDGIYFMVDIYASSNLEENLDHPLGPALYSISTAHCMTVSLAQNGLGLGTMWGYQKALSMLKEAGFSSTTMERLEEDIQNVYYISKK